MVRAISWLDEYEDWQSALVLCDSKSLVETLANNLMARATNTVSNRRALQEERSSNPVGARALQHSRQRDS